MRTIVLSDLHLGNGGVYDVFAGGDALPAFLERVAATPTRIVLNGDTIDFLLNDDPLEMYVARAVSQAEASISCRASASMPRSRLSRRRRVASEPNRATETSTRDARSASAFLVSL
jgi:hypothetical protein